MKKVIKITESELMELVRKVILEQDETEGNPDSVVEFLVSLYRDNGLEMPKEIKRRMSEAAVINAIITKMDKFPPTDDYDEFEYADIILGGLVYNLFPNVSEDLFYEIKDFILDEYEYIILDHHREIVGPRGLLKKGIY